MIGLSRALLRRSIGTVIAPRSLAPPLASTVWLGQLNTSPHCGETSPGTRLLSTTYSSESIDPSDESAPNKRQLAMVYTCGICETRAVKQFSAQAYENGVVIIRCPRCESLHLVADRLGYFSDKEEGWDIEKVIREKQGEDKGKFHAVNNDNVLEVTLDDFVGKDKMEELLESSSDESK